MDFLYQDEVTVPQYLDPRFHYPGHYPGQLPDTPPSQQSPDRNLDPGIVGGELDSLGDGEGGIGPSEEKTKLNWMYASQGILYYAFPIEIVWGIATGLLSLAVIIRQRKTSNDVYLLGFTLASLLLLTCGSVLKIQDYMAHNNSYQQAYGYIKSANDWLWYTALWLLVVMSLERVLTLLQNRTKNFCSALQAAAIVLVVFCVCLVSALPELWEYEAIETFEYISNRTIVISHLSDTADSFEYRIMYFWYSVTIIVLLPYPVLAVLLVVLAKSMRKSRHSKKRLEQKHAAQGAIVLGRRLSEELHLTRLYIVLIVLYVLLAGPLTFLVIVNGITPHWSWPVDDLYTGLYPIFEFTFYFYFSIQFLLYLTYYDKFRHSFLVNFCCCCCCGPCKRRRRRQQREAHHRSQQQQHHHRHSNIMAASSSSR